MKTGEINLEEVVGAVNSGEGNGNPLQYSCLENPMDRGAMGLRRVQQD